MYKKLLLILTTLSTMHYSIAMEEGRTLTLINESHCSIECTLPNGQYTYLEPQGVYFAERIVSHPESGLMCIKANEYATHPKLGFYSATVHITQATQTVTIKLFHNGYECCLPFFRRYRLHAQTTQDHSPEFTECDDPSD